jgi:hypothetical protein
VAEGDGQFGLAGAFLELPLSVQVRDATRDEIVKDIEVTWRVASGSGAGIDVVVARSDDLGIASARLRLGSDTGAYRVEATSAKRVGEAPAFSARAIPAPVLESVSALPAVAGQIVTVSGRNFRTNADENAVLFGGLRGRTLSASPTSLTVEVPRCALSRAVDVRVTIGAVTSGPLSVQTSAAPATPVNLDRGKVQRLENGALSCIQFTALPAGARYLVVPQNAVETVALPLRHELLVISGSAAPVAWPASASRSLHADRALEWESWLRQSEQTLGAVDYPSAAELESFGVDVDPQLGESRDFNVLKSDNTTRRVTAVVQAITNRAILYVDRDAPSPGLTPADLENFGGLFDDPIHTTDVRVYGAPSDIDANGKVIILFTPAVNALTARNDAGFIAGYFYGCDLVAKTRCSATNSGEIFYSMVPDPTGQFSSPRTKDVVLRTVPAVLAHEFQHMINFHRKNGRLDVLWLSEALAHSAEDVVGEEFLARGDPQTANDFQRPNSIRAQLWLGRIAETHLVAEASPGTLEQRGGAWLFLRYLMEHYGGTALLGNLTANTALGAANVTANTGRSWAELLSEFGVAVWADGAPELAGVTLEPKYTFGTLDLRARIGALSGGFPLNPASVTAQDFLRSATLGSAASDYLIVQPSATAGQQMHMAFSGLRGGPFTPASQPQLTLLRIR